MLPTKKTTDGPAPRDHWRLVRQWVIRHQRLRWSRVAGRWDHHGVAGLRSIIEAVLEEAAPGPEMVAVDVGAGTGALTLPLAGRVARVIAVDISQAMLDELGANAARNRVTNIETRVGAVEGLDLPPGSVDLVVSNYALHHLLDRDKDAAVAAIAGWLRPGGRVVIGDMMLGRGGDAEDRAIIAEKVKLLLRRGPGGWWRVAKNGWRYFARTQERPISVAAWSALFRTHGLTDVVGRRVLAEGAVVRGDRPSVS